MPQVISDVNRSLELLIRSNFPLIYNFDLLAVEFSGLSCFNYDGSISRNDGKASQTTKNTC